jgi:hypothetical protein
METLPVDRKTSGEEPSGGWDERMAEERRHSAHTTPITPRLGATGNKRGADRFVPSRRARIMLCAAMWRARRTLLEDRRAHQRGDAVREFEDAVRIAAA